MVAAENILRRHHLVYQRAAKLIGQGVQRARDGQPMVVVRRNRIPGIVRHSLVMAGGMACQHLFGPAIGRYVAAGVEEELLNPMTVAQAKDQDVRGAALAQA